MGCCGKHIKRDGKDAPNADTPKPIAPAEECVQCGEKHLSTAYALAQERGYETPNRQRIIGELVLAQWHIWKKDLKLAEAMCAVRHLIQYGKIAEVDWMELLTGMDALVKSNPPD